MKKKNTAETTQKTLKTANINLLETIENIVERVENAKGKDDRTKVSIATQKILKKLAEELNVTTNQALLFSTFINFYADSRIRNSDLTKFLKCKEIKLLRMGNDFEVLRERGLIKIRYDKEDTTYNVPADVIQALKNNEIYEYVPPIIDDLKDWFEAVCDLMSEQQRDYITISSLHSETLEMLKTYPNFEFVKKLKKQKLSRLDTLLFIYIAHEYVCHDDESVRYSDLEDHFEYHDKRTIKEFFKKKQTQLFEKGLIEFVAEEAVGQAKSVRLTNVAKDDLLMELELKPKKRKDFIMNDKIVEKTLFYNEKEGKQMSELQKLLSPDYFKTVQERLKEKGHQQGFSCLFYGSPGTGKTESVYQLAKQTRRDIFMVDISETKSMWFGESEKKIKDIFDKYRSYVNQCKSTPILVFNEADAVFGKRKDVSSGNVAQTENAIQNIILQEMENLNGILIATTNLTDNLDKAFERRFIYKIKFEKPIITAKQKIWQNKLSWLSDDEGLQLAQSFDFSGGEIDNIVRKSTINEIIFGENPQFSDLVKLCSEEKITQRPSIGFR